MRDIKWNEMIKHFMINWSCPHGVHNTMICVSKYNDTAQQIP